MCLWGVIEESVGPVTIAEWPSLLDKVKDMGYAGVEVPIAFVMKFGSANFKAALQARGLKFIAQIFSSGGGPPIPGNLNILSENGITHPCDDTTNTRNVQRHKDVWARQVDEAVVLKDVLRYVTSHTGKDYWTPEQADDMLSFCITYAAQQGVTVNHETHRSRILYSPWVMARVLAAHPALTLVADLSHFTCVAESGYADPELAAVVAALTPRVKHVHGRVGFEEGPQVPDPRVPRWRSHYDDFKRWWAAIYTAQAAAGMEVSTTTPEFGPATYCPIDPKTDLPIADVREVNHSVAVEMAAMYAGMFGAESAAVIAPTLQY